MSVIEAQHLTKYYSKARGIDDISFQVDEGRFLALLGQMGW
jgi:ABC-2 type transport system ATP-binding protein